MPVARRFARTLGLGHFKRAVIDAMESRIKAKVVLPARPLATPARYLSIAAMFKNEAPYLAEWLEFHRLVGVEHVYLYDHGSTDNFADVLAPFIKDGFVTLMPWGLPYTTGMMKAQIIAFGHALLTFGHDWRWMAFIDVDEFLFPVEGDSLLKTLSAYDDLPAVVVFWTMFGFSGHETPPQGLVTENYTMRAPFPTYAKPKSIVDPSAVRAVGGAHLFDIDAGNTSGFNEQRQLVSKSDLGNLTSKLLRLNHYYTRSRLEFESKLHRKRSVGKGLGAPGIAQVIEDTTFCDTSIFRFLPDLKARLSSR